MFWLPFQYRVSSIIKAAHRHGTSPEQKMAIGTHE